ncbi:MAG: hypothetical protein OEZ47_12245 [Gammaproteobacteria bacterium]|nr:hypothetical protein [Gammaproteobacteria bacterium]
MSEFFQNLPDGWTIYLWLVVAAMILIAAGFALRWAAKNKQFDEDIKYVIFDEKDKEKMTSEDYEKYKEVMKEQEELRVDYLKQKAAEKAKQNAKR